ncbi:MAG: histidine kinase N-terminal 7TM domain-containing protein [Anaerolineae bacterium]
MPWVHFLLVLILFATAGLAAALGGMAWRRRFVPGAGEFIALMLAAAIWAVTDAAQELTPNLAEKLIWAKISYPSIVATPVLWFLFVRRQIAAERRLTAQQWVLLWLIPLITLGLVFTTEKHPLYYTAITPAETSVGPMAIYHYGIWAWVQLGYSALLVLSGTFLLFRAAGPSTGRRHVRMMLLAMGALIPLAAGLAHMLKISPIPGMDLTPIAFAVTGLIYAFVLFHFDLFHLMPIAREAVVEQMADGVLVLGADDRIADVNPAAERLLGRPLDALVGLPVGRAMAGWRAADGRPPDARQTDLQIVSTADGGRYLEWRASPLTDPAGQTAARLVILRDVTDRRKAEAALHESQRAYATLLSNLPGIAYRCRNDPQWTMEFISEGCRELTGYPAEDLLGNRRLAFADLIHEEDRAKVWDDVQAAVQAHRPYQLTYRIRTADGAEKWVWEQGRGVYDAAGNLLALEGFIADFTERVRAEQAEQEQRRFAEALREATAALSSTLDLDELFDRILEQLGRVIAHDAALIYLIEGEHTRAVRWRAAAGIEIGPLVNQRWHIPTTPNLQAMLEQRRPAVVPDTAAEPTWIVLPGAEWIASHLAAPIGFRDQIFGYLEVNSRRPGFYTPTEGERVRAFADQAGLAIQNARLFDEARRRAGQMAMLNRIGQAITAGLSMEQVLRTVHEQCRQIAEIGAFYIALYDESTGDIRYPLFVDGDTPVAVPEFNIRSQASMAGVVIGRAQTVYVPDTLDPQARAAYPITYLGQTMRTYLGVPLILRDRVVGVLSAQNRQPNAYTAEQIRLFEMLATQVAIAVDNARLFETVQHERRYLEAMINHNPGGIVVIDREGRVKRWSPAAERIFGYAAAEAIGRNIDLLICCGSPQMLREGTRLTATAFATEHVMHIVTQRQRKDGSLVDVEIYGMPGAVGADEELLLSYYDISELQAARQAAEQAKQELEERLAELTRAYADLQARNEELDAFAYTVAYDLRSPLGNIIGYADLLRWDAPTMDGREVADLALEMYRQGQIMRNILDELFLLGTLRKEEIRLEPLNMEEAVAEALERLADQIARAEADLRTPASWPTAVGYHPWIVEVWVNYVSNAITYGGKPPVVELGADTTADGMVRFWVRDNGAGISPEDREHIFEPFAHLSQVRASGYGLGLSVVHRIITRLGGQVGVESEPGQGSLFYFTLPPAMR